MTAYRGMACRAGSDHVCTRCRWVVPRGAVAYLTSTGWMCPACSSTPEHD